MELKEIKNRVLSGQPVTEKEYAFLLRNDKQALFAFFIQNNPGSMNNVLRHGLNYSELGFNPDVKAISRIVDIIISNNDVEEIEYIIENFKVDESKISDELRTELNGIFDFMPPVIPISSERTASEIVGNVGTSIGGFLNPIFGSTTTTTTTAPVTKGSTSSTGIIVLVVVVLVAVVAFFAFNKNKS